MERLVASDISRLERMGQVNKLVVGCIMPTLGGVTCEPRTRGRVEAGYQRALQAQQSMYAPSKPCFFAPRTRNFRSATATLDLHGGELAKSITIPKLAGAELLPVRSSSCCPDMASGVSYLKPVRDLGGVFEEVHDFCDDTCFGWDPFCISAGLCSGFVATCHDIRVRQTPKA